MKLIFTNITQPKFKITGEYDIDIPTSFIENHGKEMDQYLQYNETIKSMTVKQTQLLVNLKQKFISEIKITNPEYFL